MNSGFAYQEVSTAAVLGMTLTALLSILVPVILLIVWKKKKKADIAPFFIGAATFIVFSLILESIMHQIVLKSSIGPAITGNIFLYGLYGGLAAGIFEEAGRFVSMKLFMKKSLNRENSVMFGIGHGGIESIILGGLSNVSNLVTALTISIMGIDALLAAVPEDLRSTTYTQLAPLWTTPATAFYLAAFERMAAICIHLCCSYIVFRAVSDKKISRLFLAILIHAFVDSVIVIINSLAGMWASEGALAAMVIVLIVFTVKSYRKCIAINPENP